MELVVNGVTTTYKNKTAVDNVIDLGKSVLGIFTGKFENMSQVKEVIKKGGLIDY